MRVSLAFALFLAALAAAGLAHAQDPAPKPHIGVLDFDKAGASTEQALALTNQLRADLLRTGRFIVVDRSQINEILDEQALQQSGCTSEECAVQVGRILGIQKIVSGTLTRVSGELWQVSAMLVDVETAQTERAETLNHQGGFPDLLIAGMPKLAERLAQAVTAKPPVIAQPRPAAPPATGDPSLTAWRVQWIGALTLGLASAYFGYSEMQATADANDKQKALLADLDAAATEAEYSALLKRLKSAQSSADTHKQNSDYGSAATALFLGAAAWIYFDPPAADAVSANWLPLLLPRRDGLRVAVLARW